jgi:hypothetical protein
MSSAHNQVTLLNALEHLYYEIQMFVELTVTETQYSIHVQFAILESWLIHLRSIDDMLRDCRKGDDILISDFMPHVIPRLIDEELRVRINKEIAHITSQRKDYGPRKHWDRAAIFRNAWPGIELMILLLDRWLGNNDADSPWRLELVALRARGSELFARVESRSGYGNMDANSAPQLFCL